MKAWDVCVVCGGTLRPVGDGTLCCDGCGQLEPETAR